MATVDLGIIITAFDKATAPLRRVARGMNRVGRAADKIRPRLRAIHVVLLSIATGSGLAFAKQITDVVASMELLFVRLARVEGGLKAGSQVFNQLVDTYKSAPVQIDAVADAFVRLRASGLNTQDALRSLQALTDAVLAFGGGTDELRRAGIVVQQIVGKGVLQMEELRQQLGEVIPSALRILADQYGISIAELIERVGEGTIVGLDAIKKLTAGLEEEFAGTTKSMEQSLRGTIERLKSTAKVSLFDQFEFQTDAADQMVKLIDDLTDKIEQFIRSINQDDVDSFFATLRTGANTIALVIDQISGVVGAVKDFANAVVDAGSDFINFVGDVTSKSEEMRSKLEKIASGTTGALSWGLIGALLFGLPGFIAGMFAFIVQKTREVISIASLGKHALPEGMDMSDVSDKSKAIMRELRNVDIAHKGSQYFLPPPFNLLASDNKIINQAAKVKVEQLQKDLRQSLKLDQMNAQSVDMFNKRMKSMTENSRRFREHIQGMDKSFIDFSTKLDRFGKKATGATMTRSERMTRELKQFEAQLEQFKKQRDKLLDDDRPGAARVAKQFGKNIEAAKEKIEEYKGAIAALRKEEMAKTGAKGARIADQMNDKWGRAIDVIRQLKAQFLGGSDSLDNALAKAGKRFNDVRRQLEEVAERAKKVGDAKMLAAVKEQFELLDELQGKVIEKLQKEFALKQKIFALDMQRMQMDAQRKIEDLKRDQSGLSGLFSSAAYDSAREKIRQYKDDIASLDIQIGKLEIKALTAFGKKKEAIQKTIEKLNELRALTVRASEQTTALGELNKQFWSDIGNTISSSISSGLKDLITGAKSAKEVLLDMYDKITAAAIDYLIELIKIQALQAIVGGPGGGGSGGEGGLGFFGKIFSSLFGAANGAAFNGTITPFANGGVVAKPTMFGVAGENNKKEGILPLERIGGKLGVNAAGQGGDSYTFQIQAIDTQSGMEFMMKNADHFINMIDQRRRLNRGPRRL